MSAIARADIVATARAWLDTPFHHQAARRGVGADCIGVVSGVAADHGMPEAAAWRADARFRGYGRLPLPAKLLEACDQYLDRVRIADVAPGDILVFVVSRKDTDPREPMHFAIVSGVDPLTIIHGWAMAGKVVENRVDEKWRRRILRAYRYRAELV